MNTHTHRDQEDKTDRRGHEEPLEQDLYCVERESPDSLDDPVQRCSHNRSSATPKTTDQTFFDSITCSFLWSFAGRIAALSGCLICTVRLMQVSAAWSARHQVFMWGNVLCYQPRITLHGRTTIALFPKNNIWMPGRLCLVLRKWQIEDPDTQLLPDCWECFIQRTS